VNRKKIERKFRGFIEHISTLGRLINYETLILGKGVIGTVVGGLILVSLALISGSKNTMPFTAWIFFEVLTPLTMMFLVIFLVSSDRAISMFERIFTLPSFGTGVYLRRLIIALSIDGLIVFFLAIVWQIKPGAPLVSRILITALPPVFFLSCLGFLGAVLLNDGNAGAAVAGPWWLINHFFLKKYGEPGWIKYIFLFKETYYPGSVTFWWNLISNNPALSQELLCFPQNDGYQPNKGYC